MLDTSAAARGLWRALVTAGAGAAVLACGAPRVENRSEAETTSFETVTASPELAGWAELAVERWSIATGRPWVFGGATNEDVGATFHIAPGTPPPGFVAFAYGNGRVVVSPAWVGSSLIGTVLMHELGHAFRGDHHYGGGVMYYAIGDGVMTSCLTPADLEWACRDFECTDFASECSQPRADDVEQGELMPCFRATERVGTGARAEPDDASPATLAAASSFRPR